MKRYILLIKNSSWDKYGYQLQRLVRMHLEDGGNCTNCPPHKQCTVQDDKLCPVLIAEQCSIGVSEESDWSVVINEIFINYPKQDTTFMFLIDSTSGVIEIYKGDGELDEIKKKNLMPCLSLYTSLTGNRPPVWSFKDLRGYAKFFEIALN